MSAPQQFATEAQNFKYGFLTASVSSTLAKSLGETVDQASIQQLGKGLEFLNEIRAGANLVSTGEPGGMASASSVELLGYALQPLTSIEDIQKESEQEKLLEIMISNMADCLAGIIEKRKIPSKGDPSLELTRRFFESISQAFLSSLSTISESKGDVPE